MIPSRLYHASIMLFWVCYLSLVALAVTYAPQGGIELAGLALFADTGLIATTVAAMSSIGFSELGQSVIFGLLGGFALASAGLLLFAMMFFVFGHEREQHEARPLAEGAVACTALAAILTAIVSFAGGQAGVLLALEFGALGGLFLTVMSLFRSVIEPDEVADEGVRGLEQVIADHAASHAHYSAQLAAMSRRGSGS